MKELFILGNWKSNKTLDEARTWVTDVTEAFPHLPENLHVIVCPAYHHLPVFTGSLPFAVGTQDMSPYVSGAYTGEISASMVQGLVTYALIGHSERRKHLGETNELVAEKVKQCLSIGIRPVVCVSEVAQAEALAHLVPDFQKTGLILYEPLFAIGSGKSDTPENANQTAGSIQAVVPVPVLYGGSVVPGNVKGFMEVEHLAGVGVGGASLDPQKFIALINAAK